MAGGEAPYGGAAVRDFVADAFAHMKFIGHTPAATAWFEKAGIGEKRDEGFIALNKKLTVQHS